MTNSEIDHTLELLKQAIVICIEECSAVEDVFRHCDSLLAEYLACPRGEFEWRFCGSLGFGGKLRYSNDGFRVTCYSEDRTPECDKCIQTANARLRMLNEQ
jgi:hypothetical protein